MRGFEYKTFQGEPSLDLFKHWGSIPAPGILCKFVTSLKRVKAICNTFKPALQFNHVNIASLSENTLFMHQWHKTTFKPFLFVFLFLPNGRDYWISIWTLPSPIVLHSCVHSHSARKCSDMFCFQH